MYKRQDRQIRYSTRTLLYATSLIAWVLGVNSWLGDPYGWLTAIPLTFCLPIWITNPWTFVGGTLGFAVLAIIGELSFVGFEWSDVKHWLAIITVGAYGCACGTSIHAFVRGQRLLGGIICGISIFAFVVVLQY